MARITNALCALAANTAIGAVVALTACPAAWALATPPCTTVPALPAITIIPISNGLSTYCVSDHGWSDAWFVRSSPVIYDPRIDVLSGDDAPNLHFGIRGGAPWPVASGFGWISPVMDGGSLEPVEFTGSPWTVTTPVAMIGPTTARSLVSHPLGLDLQITTSLDPLGEEVTQTFLLTNTTAGETFEDIVFADYFNFHPNGSDLDNFRKGTLTYAALSGLTVTGPDDGTLIAFGSMRGERVDDFHGSNATFAAVPDIAIDMVQTIGYPDPALPDAAYTAGPGDAAGGLGWRLPDLAPGESTSFTIFKQALPLMRVPEPAGLAVSVLALALALLAGAWPSQRRLGAALAGFAASVCIATFGIGPAQAMPCPALTPGCFNIENANGSTGWHIEYDPAKVIDPSFSGTPGNARGKDGDLDLDAVIFTTLSPIEIRFIQDRDAPNNEVNFGLRITLRFDITNSTTNAWGGFTMRLRDDVADFDPEDEPEHPGFAHFHSLGADSPQVFLPFTRTSPGNPNFTIGSATRTQRADVYELGNGRFEKDATHSWTGIGIHEWEQPGVQRNFTLILTPRPVSAPGTLALLCIAWLAIGTRRR